jgi:integrase
MMKPKRTKRMEHGHIEKRSEGKYLVRWRTKDDATGMSKQVSRVVAGDYGAALSFLCEKVNNPEPAVEKPERTFNSFLENEWAGYVRENWKPSTQNTQGSLARRHITPFFEKMVVSKILASDIVAFHTGLEAKTLAKRTRRLVHSILVTMFGLMVDDDIITRNPIKRRFFKKEGEKAKKPALNETQLAQLLKAVPIRYRAFFTTLALTGIRSGEALGLTWGDVDFAGREFHVRRAIWRGKPTSPKTECSLRSRPMCQQLYDALLNHRTLAVYKQSTNYVFSSSTAAPFNPDRLRAVLRTALKEIGIVFEKRCDGMHLLRHSSGSIVYKCTGGDIKAAQSWLGHSNSRITMDTYVHGASDQDQRSAARLAEGLYPSAETPGTMH